MTPIIGLAIRSALMLAIGLLLSACLAKRSAALRHRVLAASLLAAVLVIPFSLTLPGWNILLPAPPLNASPAVTTTIAVEPQPARPMPPPPHPSAISPLVLLWLAGVVVAAAALTAGLVRVSRVAGRASRIEDPRWLEILHAVAERYGLSRRVAVLLTDSPDMLATWGIVRPHVLLPRHARDWTLERVHVVLCHELAHIRRHDWLVQIGAETLRAILWFNPLVWIVCTRLRRESEQACDDEVLGAGVGVRQYASHLIELARQCRRRGVRWESALPMAHASTLERRIAAMLNPRLDRRAPSRRAVAALVVLLLFVALPIAALRARQSGPVPLTGTIYDVTGGVMPGVEVTLLDANQVIQFVTSNASGRFEFAPLIAGKYVLEVKLPGFRTLRQEFELRTARDWDRAVTLQVGEVQETITVRGSRASLPKPAMASGTEAQPVRIGGNIRPPRKVRDVKPVYPPTMHAAGFTGLVPVQAIIGRDGSVASVRVLSAQVHPDFAIAAVDAVRQWRFTPTLLNGEPVEVVMTVSVRFDLED